MLIDVTAFVPARVMQRGHSTAVCSVDVVPGVYEPPDRFEIFVQGRFVQESFAVAQVHLHVDCCYDVV